MWRDGILSIPNTLLHSPPSLAGAGNLPELDTFPDTNGRYSTSDTQARMHPILPALRMTHLLCPHSLVQASSPPPGPSHQISLLSLHPIPCGLSTHSSRDDPVPLLLIASPSMDASSVSGKKCRAFTKAFRALIHLSRISQFLLLCRVPSASWEPRTTLSLVLLTSMPGQVPSEIVSSLLCPGLACPGPGPWAGTSCSPWANSSIHHIPEHIFCHLCPCLSTYLLSPTSLPAPTGSPRPLFKRFYLFMRDTERQTETKTKAEGEAGSMQGANVGLDPGTPGSHPGLKADAKALSHPGIPPGSPLRAELRSDSSLGPKAWST